MQDWPRWPGARLMADAWQRHSGSMSTASRTSTPRRPYRAGNVIDPSPGPRRVAAARLPVAVRGHNRHGMMVTAGINSLTLTVLAHHR